MNLPNLGDGKHSTHKMDHDLGSIMASGVALMSLYVRDCTCIRRPQPMPRPHRRCGTLALAMSGGSHEPFGPQASGFTGFQDCPLPGLKPRKRSLADSTSHLGHRHLVLLAIETAVCPPSNLGKASQRLQRAIWATRVWFI